MIPRFLRPRLRLRLPPGPKQYRQQRQQQQQRCNSNSNNNHSPPPPPNTTKTSTPSTPSSSSASQSRANAILSRLPKPLQRYTTRLRNAPLSHVASFLILHELTAVIPLFALVGLFHYTSWVPLGYMTEHYGAYVREGVGRFERYFRKKGWFGFDDSDKQQEPNTTAAATDRGQEDDAIAIQRLESEDTRYKIVVEVALAYAITKVLLPVRIVGSLWATPWFAGLLTRIRSVAIKK